MLLEITCEGAMDEIMARIIAHSGLSSISERRTELDLLLQRRLEELELDSLSDYLLQALSGETARDEMDFLVEEMTIGETYFFRHPQMIEALKAHLAAACRDGRTEPFAVWSAACSIGCEPYTIAIILQEVRQQFPALDYRIFASDINQHFLRKARSADYSKWSLRNLDAELVERYFRIEDAVYSLLPECRRNVEYFQHNLMQGIPAQKIPEHESLDVILCRNVLIYFDYDTIRQLKDVFYKALKPGGWLLLGASEANAQIFSGFEAVNVAGAVLFRKPMHPQAKLRSEPKPQPLRPNLPVLLPRLSLPKVAQVEAPRPQALVQKKLPHHILIGQQQYALALDSILETLRVDDLNAHLHLLAGYLCRKLGRESAAGGFYKKAIYLNRKSIEAHYLFACYLLDHDEHDRMLRECNVASKLIEATPSSELELPEERVLSADLRVRIDQLREAVCNG